MKKQSFIKAAFIACCILLAAGCKIMPGYHVVQEVRKSAINPMQSNLVTGVWDSGDIVKIWYDPIDSVTVELVKYRQAQADSLLTALKACR